MSSITNKMSKLTQQNASDVITYDDKWNIIKEFITRRNNNELIKHQIETFDCFMETYINNTITKDIYTKTKPLKIEKKISETESIFYSIYFTNVSFGKPVYYGENGKLNVMYPEIARNNNLTYSRSLCADINMTSRIESNGKVIDAKNPKPIKNQIIGYVPVMVGSKYCLTSEKIYNNKDKCQYDKGGYFIVGGMDKVIVCQERMSDNNPLVYKLKGKKYSHVCEVRTNNNITTMSQLFSVYFLSKDGVSGAKVFRARFGNLKDDISLFILMKYLGAETDEDIINYILGADKNDKNFADCVELLKSSMIEMVNILKEQDIELYLRKYLKNKRKPVRDVIDYYVLKEVGSSKKKLYYIGHMIKKVLMVLLNLEKEADRDNFINKRLETPGILMAQLFTKLFKKTITSLHKSILKENTKKLDLDITRFIKKNIIENGFKQSLGTGNWDVKMSNENKKIGVSQVLNRLTFSATQSHLRRINSPISKTGKIVEPRKLHNSHFGFIDPVESPEGHGVGLTKNLALSTNITSYTDIRPIKAALENLNVRLIDDIEPMELNKTITRIFINGIIYGITETPEDIVNTLKKIRRQGKLSYYISISFKYRKNEIHILSDEGRMTRPLFVVKNNKINISKTNLTKLRNGKLKWINILKAGIIEFLDISEIEYSMVAKEEKDLNDKHIKYTHCEIHHSLLLGICASIIPFPQHNQAPRNIYQTCQGKQAMGINSTDVFKRMDAMNHVLHYPQKPIIYTQASELIGMNAMPAGVNVIIAIATHNGFNIEDSVVINRGAIERGLFHSTFYRTYKTDEKKDLTALAEEKFCIPDKTRCIGLRQGSYTNLDTTGLIKEGSVVKGNDVIIGKMTPITKQAYSNKKNLKYKDTSVQVRHNEEGIVDKVVMTHNSDGYRLAKVKVRSIRIPEIADKLSSRHGQKGTIGYIEEEENMPFTEDGLIPDIIINPHAIPSRMTCGQLIEMVLSKVGALEGKYIDGTPFEKLEIDEIGSLLEDVGFDKSGNEVMYNGETGEKIKSKIFIGPCYYQRLKHLVHDKMHARARGPVNNLTKQPTGGRSRDGGLRLGEMESECILSHGMAYFMKDKYNDCSDKFNVFVCDKCHNIANVNPERGISSCNTCGNKINFSNISMPYASKLFFQELKSMGLNAKYHV